MHTFAAPAEVVGFQTATQHGSSSEVTLHLRNAEMSYQADVIGVSNRPPRGPAISSPGARSIGLS